MMAEVLLAISYATRPKLVNGGGMWSTIKMEEYKVLYYKKDTLHRKHSIILDP